jgi:hypothetical protein
MIRKSLLLVVAMALGCGSSGGADPAPSGNHAPVVKSSVATAAVVMGESTQLSTTATDEDHDPLTFSWVQTSPASPQGSFSSQGVASPTWTAPTVAQLTKFTLTVTVSDGKGGTKTASATVYVKTSTETSFIGEVMPIFQPCAVCHQGSSTVGSLLSLEPDKAYDQLVNVPARQSCAPELRVTPGDPDASVLFLKIAGTTCGGRMPPAAPTYFDQQPDKLATVRTWIEQGAQDN